MMKTSFLIALLAFPLYLVFMFSSYNAETDEGTYGPFEIGQTKSEVLEIIKRHGEWPAHPERPGMVWGGLDQDNNPKTEYLIAPAIEVNLGYMAFQRVEFEADVVVRHMLVLPKCCGSSYSAREHRKQEADARDLTALSSRTFAGQPRQDYFRVLDTLGLRDRATISATIVELEYNRDFHTPHWDRKTDYSTLAYEKHLMSNDRWSKHGFKFLAWYSWFDDPYTSTVHLHFKENRLFWIRHYHSPNELP